MKTKRILVIAIFGLASFTTNALGAELSAKASALPEELSQGLVLYYSFDSEPSAKEIVDESGKGNNGLPVNVQWVKEGHQGGCTSFGPTNSYITVPNKDSINPPRLTMAAWIKTSCKDAVWPRIFDKGTDKGYTLTMGSKRWKGQVCLEVGPANVFSGIDVQVADGQWRHIVGTFDGADAKLYVDGRLIRTGHWVGEVGITPYDLTIGANRSNPKADKGEVGVSFNGMMDDVMMFNRALSTDEVQALFKVQGGMLGAKLKNSSLVTITPAKPAAQNKPGADERLKQVKQLLDQGLIDKENYDRKVKEIIDSI